MLIDLMGWGFNFAFQRYGDEWYCGFIDACSILLNAKESPKYQGKEAEVTNALLRRLLDTPDASMTHFRQMTGEFVMSVAYGIDVRSSDDPYIYLARDALQSFNVASLPGKYLVNTFSILKHVPRWFPGAGFKRYAEEGRKLTRACWSSRWPKLDDRWWPSGPALASNDMSGQLQRPCTSVEPTRPSHRFGTSILAMLANPEAQRKAPAEIDCVTGGKFLSGFDDNGWLPYITAFVLVALFLFPFNVEQVVYPDPYVFNQEQFLLDGEPNPAVKLPEVAFGYGCRVCPGRHVATSALWIAIASVLAAFDIKKAVDE
ncbi:cytochrome P450 [Mycena leptocephala]|nr:cytochrome P450 [Mycena leptocephala]